LLLLYLVGCFYYGINDAWSHKHQTFGCLQCVWLATLSSVPRLIRTKWIVRHQKRLKTHVLFKLNTCIKCKQIVLRGLCLYYAYLKRKTGVYNTDGAVCLYVKECEYLSEREAILLHWYFLTSLSLLFEWCYPLNVNSYLNL